MEKQYYITPEDQQNLIISMNLQCNFEIGAKTQMVKIKMIYNLCIVVLFLTENGTILQKWNCIENENGVYNSQIITKNLTTKSQNICDKTKCDRISNNIKCELCENDIEDLLK